MNDYKMHATSNLHGLSDADSILTPSSNDPTPMHHYQHHQHHHQQQAEHSGKARNATASNGNGAGAGAGAITSMPFGDISSIYLVETFYISSKKNTVFQVRLTEKGLSLRKESNGTAKEQTILVQDIIGCRCLRSQRKRTGAASACTCTTLAGQQNLRVVEATSAELDESDISAYLYIYAYILKRTRRASGGRRERTTITLRFRSFDKYEDNNREAQKWRSAIKLLLGEEFQSMVDVSSGLATTALVQPVRATDPRRVLVILNPKSGSGKARETFQQRVAPIFVEAEIAFDLQVTKCANYARDFVRSRDIFGWRSIVVVGGDGIFFEVVNGLFERPDWERAMAELPLGIIPCGSGNGLARTIAHVYNEPYEPKPVLGAALTVVRGKPTDMDLVRVETRSQIVFSFLSVGWGLISDIDIESERLRMIGYQRFTIWSLHRLISLRTYHGTVSYQRVHQTHASTSMAHPHNSYAAKSPLSNGIGGAGHHHHQQSAANSTNSSGGIRPLMKHSMSCGNQLDCDVCHGDGDCDACDTGFGDVLTLETQLGQPSPGYYRPRLDSWYSATSRKSAYYSTADSMYQSVAERLSNGGGDAGVDCVDGPASESKTPAQMYGPASRLPALTAPVPDGWTVERGEFVMVHASYQTHIGSDCFFAPQSQLNDGLIWLCVIRAGATRPDLLKFLLGMSNGTHLPQQNRFIEMIPVTAFRIEPMEVGMGGASGTATEAAGAATASAEQGHGHFTVDGERVEYGPIQGEVVPGLAQVMAPIYTT